MAREGRYLRSYYSPRPWAATHVYDADDVNAFTLRWGDWRLAWGGYWLWQPVHFVSISLDASPTVGVVLDTSPKAGVYLEVRPTIHLGVRM